MAGRTFRTVGIFAAGGIATWSLMQSVQRSNWTGSVWPTNLGISKELFSVPQEPGIASMPHALHQDLASSIRQQTVSANNIPLNPYSASIQESLVKLSQWRTVNSIPGYVMGVSVRGKTVWVHGDGYADLENGIPCSGDTVMRIASISKSITAALLGKMVQEGKLDLDRPIREYLTPEQWPDKFWENEKVDITLRQLVSHVGGIRHYKKPEKPKEEKNGTNNNNNGNGNEFAKEEYFLNENFPTVIDSLKLFKDDPLVAKPGTKYVYTTFGWTLISAVMESQMEKKNFTKSLTTFLTELGMKNTRLDENGPLIYNRAHYYYVDPKSGGLKNVPTVDNSYKWAGGGLLSTVGDLLKFGNVMLYSWKGGDQEGRPGVLEKKTVDEMWTPNEATKKADGFGGYGIGWAVVRDETAKKAYASTPRYSTYFSHSGGAVGASSLLLIVPEQELVVALIINLQAAKELYRIGYDVTDAFAKNVPKIVENTSEKKASS